MGRAKGRYGERRFQLAVERDEKFGFGGLDDGTSVSVKHIDSSLLSTGKEGIFCVWGGGELAVGGGGKEVVVEMRAVWYRRVVVVCEGWLKFVYHCTRGW